MFTPGGCMASTERRRPAADFPSAALLAFALGLLPGPVDVHPVGFGLGAPQRRALPLGLLQLLLPLDQLPDLRALLLEDEGPRVLQLRRAVGEVLLEAPERLLGGGPLGLEAGRYPLELLALGDEALPLPLERHPLRLRLGALAGQGLDQPLQLALPSLGQRPRLP